MVLMKCLAQQRINDINDMRTIVCNNNSMMKVKSVIILNHNHKS